MKVEIEFAASLHARNFQLTVSIVQTSGHYDVLDAQALGGLRDGGGERRPLRLRDEKAGGLDGGVAVGVG